MALDDMPDVCSSCF